VLASEQVSEADWCEQVSEARASACHWCLRELVRKTSVSKTSVSKSARLHT
jgi:hypothetical protein